MRQYVLEIDYTIVVEDTNDDPGEVSDNFIARLTELAASNDHILGLSVQVLPIPELRGSSNRRDATDPEAECKESI
jgi:hypothetical protein